MSQLLKDLFDSSYARHREFRRMDSCFHAFSGAIIETFREMDYRLVGFDTVHARELGLGLGGARAEKSSYTLALELEQPDGDRVTLEIEPYRLNHTFLKTIGPVAEIHFSLSQRVHDPDQMMQAQTSRMRLGMGQFLGFTSGSGQLDRGAGLSEPGNLRFSLQGCQAVASINLILNLRDYAVDELDYNKDKIRTSLESTIYGLEKFVNGMLGRKEESSLNPTPAPTQASSSVGRALFPS